MIKKLTILIILLFSFSCESPWDIDTPKKIILPDPVDSVPLSLVSIFVETNGVTEQFVLEKAMLEIDTVSKSPLVWGSVVLSSTITSNFSSTKIALYSLEINLNNLTITGNPIRLSSSSTPMSNAKYKIHRWTNSDYDTTIICDAVKNKTDITFSQERDKKELWIYLDANIYNVRYDDIGGNLVRIHDSLFITSRLHFNY